MDQFSLIEQLTRCIDHHKVIKIELEWLDGRMETCHFEPYLIGDNPVIMSTFIYGRVSEKDQLAYIPVQYIGSFIETVDDFVVDEKNKAFFIFDVEKNKVKNHIAEIQIVDIFEPDEEIEAEGIFVCPFCNSKANCEHIAIEYDMSFNELKGGSEEGLREVSTVISNIFADLIERKKAVYFMDIIPSEYKDYGKYFDELWNYANYRNEQHESLVDMYNESFLVFIAFLFRDLENSYPVIPKAYKEIDGAPGSDSVMLGYYAEEPSIVWKSFAEFVRQILKDSLKGKYGIK
jgi:hypothetical protein